MCTRSSSNLPGESSPNPNSLNPKRRNRRRSKQPFIMEESPVDTIADQRTMEELLRAPTEGYAEVRNSRNKSINSQVKSSDANSSSSSEIAKLTNAVNQQTSAVTTAITAILKQFQATPPPASEKADNIQGYVSAAAVNYNLMNQVVPLSELEKIKKMNEINMKSMQTQINNVKNEFRNEMKTSIQASMSNQTNELKNMMASFFQMNTASTSGSGPLPSNTIANPKGKLKAITTRSGLVLDGPSVPMPPPFINPKEDERVEETLTDQDLAEYTIKVPPPLIQKHKPPSQRNFVVHQRDPLHPNIPYPSRRHKKKQHGKDEVQIHNWNCKRCNCFGLEVTFLANFIIVNYESDPRVPLILGRPFLRTARALIDVHREEMILRDDDERLTLNIRHDTSSHSNQPQKESINMINIFDDSCEDYLEELFATNHLSGNPTFSSHSDLTSPKVKDDIFVWRKAIITSFSPTYLLEEFADELALITFPPGNDDLPFDIESDLKEIEYLLNHDPIKEIDFILEDSIDEGNLAEPNDNLFDTMPEMFTDEHALDSSPSIYDDFNDDLDEFESDNDDAYNDPFDFKGEKIKESKLLIDELDLPRSSDFLPSPEYDSFLFEDFFEVDALPSIKNEDKAFNPPIYELPFHKEVLGSKTLLLFSSENDEKFFKPGILTSKGVHSSLLSKLSHRGPKAFKVIKIGESPMNIFPCSFGEDIHILDVPYLYFYPS
uniref:Reverse transcriptase domain-containing protein n=1 Tax=Tanacetum cinerariifolium TaxID=118510 RepID=A0A6L2NQP5_TANCI|nr:hypothetical protein [Tanacetum cinerariifolium]